MITYEDIFERCKNLEQLRMAYNDLLESCDDLSEIKHIDNAYLKEYNRRKENDRK